MNEQLKGILQGEKTMKTKKICVLCCTAVVFLVATACGTSDGSTEATSSSNDVSSNETVSVIDYESDNKLLENPKNIAGNGYIIINDEADYPDFIKDLRYVEKIDDDLYSVRDFADNEIFTFESEKYTLCFSEGISHFCKDGKWGFVDLDGNVIIES